MAYAKETICIQSGWKPKNGEPRVLPIYQSTTFKYESSEQMGRLLIWRNPDIFTAVWQIRPTTASHRKSVNWRAAQQRC